MSGWSSAGRFHHAQSQVHRFLNSVGGYVRHQDSYSLGAARVLMPHIVAPMEELMAMHTSWDVLAENCKLFVTFGGVPRKNAQINAGGATLHHVKGGLYGQQPSLSALDNGNLKFTTDFRSVYASVLQGYLNAPASELLGGNYEILPLLKA